MKSQVNMDNFSLVSFIGKGSYADVTLVRKNDTGKLYALKSLKKKYIIKKKQETNVMLERNILTQVDHPFIVKLSYSFQNDRKLFFALEYCPGGDLFGLLCKRKTKRLKFQEVQMYAAQMVLALQYLHSKNILYRDLKPQNVILDSEGYIRLTDFGLSKVQLNGEKALNICGTPQYIAPQVLKKEGASKPIDWWCLGCIIYQMAVGLPPFYCPSRTQLFEKIKSGEPKYPMSMNPAVKRIVQAFLVKDSNHRLGTAGAQQIKNHQFFQGIDWQALYKKQIKPINAPKLESQDDISHFDNQFTQCQLEQFNCSPPLSENSNNFDGFSFNKSNEFQCFELEEETSQNMEKQEQRSKKQIFMESEGEDAQFQMKMQAQQ